MDSRTTRILGAIAVAVALLLVWVSLDESVVLGSTEVPAWLAILVAYGAGVVAGWAASKR